MASKTADELAVEIEELLGLPEETIATEEGGKRVSLTVAQAQALLAKVER